MSNEMNSEMSENTNNEMNDEMIELDHRKQIKKDVNRLVGGLFLYLAIGFICFIIYLIGYMVIDIVLHGGPTKTLVAKMDADMMKTGIPYIVNIFFGIPLLFLFFKKVKQKKLTDVNKAMKRADFFILLCCFMSTQIIFYTIGFGTEKVFNLFGYSIKSSIEAAGSTSTTISMFLYSSILGPIAEEIIFRGFVMRGLERHGKKFAIIVSALLFGAYHGNLIQGLFAFAVGLVLGYVAMEYSLKWAIVLHITNNFIFGDLLSYAVAGLNTSIQTLINLSMEGLFGIGTLVIFIVKRKEIAAYWKENKAVGMKYALRSAGMIIFLVVMFLIALLGIERI